LHQAPNQEQIENENLDEIKTELSKPLDAYQVPIENHISPMFPLEFPDIHLFGACIKSLG
jgi:hypothetical protein